MNKWLGALFVLLALLAVAQAKIQLENKSTIVEARNAKILRRPSTCPPQLTFVHLLSS